MLLLGRLGRERNWHPGRDVETLILVHAVGQNLREAEEEGRPNLRASLRRRNRSENRRPQEAQSERPQEDPQRLGRGLRGVH